MSNLSNALPFARAGWYLFPSYWDGERHTPCVAWSTKSSDSSAQVEEWAEKLPGCYFCVNLKASNVIVIDVDNKNGKNGSEVMAEYEPLPGTMKSITPNNGEHYFFEGSCAMGANKLGEGVDIPGMVPLPGQHAKGKGLYELIQRGKPAPLPQWVVEKAGKPKERKEDPSVSLVELDQPENIQRAVSWLQTHAEEAIEGDGGDQTTYNIACRVRDMGVSESMASELMLEHWNETRAFPPWTTDELTKKVANAYRYALDRPGNATPEAIFPDTSRSTSIIRCAADITDKDIQPREWLMWSRYLRRNVTVTVAPGGAGKSALNIVECLALASGETLTENEVKQQTPVWYYNTEDDFDELNRRIRAAAVYHKITKDALKYFYYTSGRTQPLILVADDRKHGLVVNEKAVTWLIQEIKRRHAGLFVLDPFVRCHRVSENDNNAIDLVVQQLQRVADTTNCAISIVHHVSKGSTDVHGNLDKVRGASALASAVRIAHTFYSMSVKEAKDYGMSGSERLKYARLDNAKANLTPRNTTEAWYAHRSVPMRWDSDETVGTISNVKIEGVRKESQEKSITESVFRMVAPGTEVSVYNLSTEIANSGVVKLTSRSIQRKIESAFFAAQRRDSYSWVMFIDEATGTKKIQCKEVL